MLIVAGRSCKPGMENNGIKYLIVTFTYVLLLESKTVNLQ